MSTFLVYNAITVLFLCFVHRTFTTITGFILYLLLNLDDSLLKKEGLVD